MNTATIIKIDVHHIIDGVHTDECERVSGDEWNEDIPRSYVYDMEGSKIFNYGIFQCPHCKCVWNTEDRRYISLNDHYEWGIQHD